MLRRGGHRGIRVLMLIAALVLAAGVAEAGGIGPNGAARGSGFWDQLLAWVRERALEAGFANSAGNHGSSIDPNGGGPAGSGGATVTVGTVPVREPAPDSLGEIR